MFDVDKFDTESVIIPSLMVMAQAKKIGIGPINAMQLSNALRPLFNLDDSFDANTNGDKVDRFERKIRNMVSSHQTFVQAGFARHVEIEKDARIYLEISSKGSAKLMDFMIEKMFTEVLPDIHKLSASDNVAIERAGGLNPSESALSYVAKMVLAKAQWENDGEPVEVSVVRNAVKKLPGMIIEEGTSEKLNRALINLLTSHRTLEKKGFAELTGEGGKHFLKITDEGKESLLEVVLENIPAPPLEKFQQPERKPRAFGMK